MVGIRPNNLIFRACSRGLSAYIFRKYFIYILSYVLFSTYSRGYLGFIIAYALKNAQCIFWSILYSISSISCVVIQFIFSSVFGTCISNGGEWRKGGYMEAEHSLRPELPKVRGPTSRPQR